MAHTAFTFRSGGHLVSSGSEISGAIGGFLWGVVFCGQHFLCYYTVSLSSVVSF